MEFSKLEDDDPLDFNLGGILIQKGDSQERKEGSRYCFNCGRSRRSLKNRSQGRPFFSHITQWKNTLYPELSKTNNGKIVNNSDPNRLSSEPEPSYCRSARARRRSTTNSCDVTPTLNIRREVSCSLSRDMANDLSKMETCNRTCRSWTDLSYLDSVRQNAKRILTTKCSQAGLFKPETVCSSISTAGCEFPKEPKSPGSSRIVFKPTFAKALQIIRLYIVLFLAYIRDIFVSKTRAMSSIKKTTKLSNSLAYILIFLVSTSAASDLFASRRHHLRGRMGPRYPRQSGFRGRLTKPDSERCEPITVPTCKDIGYNKTDMSLSIMNKFTQAEAQLELDQFNILVKVNCSLEVKLLLCSVYTPICMKGYPHFLPPCRFVCERARKGCLPFMQKYHVEWPQSLRCEQFPTYGRGNSLCMHFNLTKTKEEIRRYEVKTTDIHPTTSRRKTTTTPTKSTTTVSTKEATVTATTAAPTKPPKYSSEDDEDIEILEERPGYPEDISGRSLRPQTTSNRTPHLCECRAPMVVIVDTTDPLYNQAVTGGVPNCAVSCKSPYFSDDQISMAEIWIKSWSIVCFIVTLMTVSTFLIDMERFKYPERPIIFLSTCYMFVSIGFLIRIIAGHEAVACAYQTDHVLYHTTGPVLCTTVFLLVYFFSMASALWWVILSMTWFLAAGLKWGSEAIEKYSQYYHAAAWLIPSLQTIMVLAMSSVDGDSLSGICFVGNQDVRALRGFVLTPLVVYLVLGGMFLLAGFVSLFRIRSRIKKDGTKTDSSKLEKLMGRIGIFSVLYMVPAAALVGCYFYEQQYRPFWEHSHNCISRDDAQTKGTTSHVMFKPVKPEFFVSMVRYLMTLLIGITNGVWICSPKTLTSWKGFYRRCVCCLHGAPCPPPCGKEIAKSNLEHGARAENIPSNQNGDMNDNNTDNRSDSRHSRNHDRFGQNGFNIKSESGKSRGTRYSQSSRQHSSRERCEVCDRSSRASTQNSRNDSHRKRRRTRSGSNRGCRSEVSRKRPSGAETTPKESDILCGSNTTSTDGSDRPLAENGRCDWESCQPQNQISQQITSTHCLTRKEQLGQSRQERLSLSSGHGSSRKNASCYCCEETRENSLKFGGKYVINSDDNLPTVSSRSCRSVTSHECGVGKSVTSLPLPESDDCDEEIDATLLNQISSHEYRHPSANSPYFHHHHHHHYHSGIQS